MGMANQIISDALTEAYSLPLNVVTQGTTPSQYWIVASFPLSQQQQLGSLVQQLQTMGYHVGFDFASDVALIPGTGLTAQLTLSYPRRGRIAGSTGLMVDVAYATEFVYPEDGTQQANKIWEMATATGGVGSTRTHIEGMSVDGYPLLENVQSHMVFSALTYYTASEVTASKPVLDAWGQNDLWLYAYPPIAPQVTVPLFNGSLNLGDFIVGDDIRLYIPPPAGKGPPICPMFPSGLDMYWRIVNNQVSVADAGVSTMTLTLNVPPSSQPTDVHNQGG
jgi:hypothetical protein